MSTACTGIKIIYFVWENNRTMYNLFFSMDELSIYKMVIIDVFFGR